MKTHLNSMQLLRNLPDFAHLKREHFNGVELEHHHVSSGLSWRPPERDIVCVIALGRLCRVRIDGETERIVEDFPAGTTVKFADVGDCEENTVLRAAASTDLVLMATAQFEELGLHHPPVAAPPASLRLALARLFGGDGAEAETFCAEMIGEFEWVHLRGGEYLFREGDAGNELYVLDSGRICVLVERDGQSRVLSEFGRGQIVGEMALLSEKPRSACAIALRDCRLLRISRALFHRVVQRHPELMSIITSALVDRLRDTSTGRQRTDANLQTIALVPLTADTPVAELSNALGRALLRFGAVETVSGSRVCRELAIDETSLDHPGNEHLVLSYLDRVESEADYVVLEAAEHTQWQSRCIRHADVVLVVARAQAPDQESSAALAGLAREVRRFAHLELLLVHSPETQLPDGTRRWFDGCGERINAHHHIRRADENDMGRLARHLVGQSIAVVLSGGGARGFAHLGVLRALDEFGIPVDHIGGSSMGSLIAGQYALGRFAVDELIEMTRELFSSGGVAREYTLPLAGLVPGKRALRAFQETFGDPDIEDLWRGYFCVACDLTSARQVVFRTGPLWSRVRASLAIPGAWVPAIDSGRVLVDGGVINNLPVDIMRRTAAGPIIASNTIREKDFSVAEHLKSYPSSAALLWQSVRFRKNGRRLPHLGDILMRSFLCSSMRHAQEVQGMASLYLKVPVEQYGMLQFADIDAIVAAGHRYATRKLATWLEGQDASNALPNR